MNVQQHPDLAWLIDYAAGTLNAGFHTVIGAHLGVCASCRAQLHTAEHIGERLSVSNLQIRPRTTAEAIRARAQRTASSASGHELAPSQPGLREYVAGSLGFDWNALNWRSGVTGLRIARLKDLEEERIWLLHAEPGIAIPEHTHNGAELTLILHGAYRTGDQHYGIGDVDENDETITHQPVVTSDGDCLSLLVFEGRLKYTGAMGIAQRVLGF